MAGGILKTFGVLSILLGCLLLLGGLAAAAYGFYDQEEHAEDTGPLGVGEDPERTEQNDMLLVGGAVAAGAGLLFLIVGIILVASGSGRAARARHRELLEATAGPAGSAVGAAPTAALEPSATKPTEEYPDDPTRRRIRKAAPFLVALGVLLFAGVVVLAVSGGGPLDEMKGSARSSESDGPVLLDTETYDRSIPATVTVMGSSRTHESTSHPFTAKTGTDIIDANVTWEPVDTGSASIQFSIEIQIDGEWTAIGETTSGSPLTLRVDDKDKEWDLSGASMRFRAFPGDDGINEAQDYTVVLTYYSR